MLFSRRKVLFVGALLVVVDLIVYLRTLAPVVQFVDSGELAAACATLGIAHPTGYPLYTLVGRFFALLPSHSVIFNLGLLSLLFACAGNLFLFFIVLRILKSRSQTAIWAALLSGLIFSFTPVWWSQATSNEVYSCNILFFGLVLILALMLGEESRKTGSSKTLYLLIFVYGLSFGNHMLSILLLPALLYLLLTYEGKALIRPHRLLPAVLLFVLGLSVYLYLPIRSAQNPLLDWGNPETWTAFKRHISGQQYRAWIFTLSPDSLIVNLKGFVRLFFRQFPLYLLPFTLLGIWRLLVHRRTILVFLSILFLTNVFYGINYEIFDIDPYFLGAFFVNALFLGNGFFLLFEKSQRNKLPRPAKLGVLCLLALIPLIAVVKDYRRQDKSDNYLAYDLGCNLLRSMRKDALILSDVWDHTSLWQYLRYVELKRPDVVFISKRLCFHSWYSEVLKYDYPQIYRTSQDQIEPYLKDVRKYERGEPCDSGLVVGEYLDLLNGFLVRNANQRPICHDLSEDPVIGSMFVRIPEGLVSCFKDTFGYYPYDFPKFELRGLKEKYPYLDQRTRVYLSPYSFMTQSRIAYLLDLGLEEQARDLWLRYESILSE